MLTDISVESVSSSSKANKQPWLSLNARLAFHTENSGIDLDLERQAARSFFVDNINTKMQFFHGLDERLRYCVENGYYHKAILDQYTQEDIAAFDKQVYGYKFRFVTLCGASKFYSNYAMTRTDGERYLERFEDRVMMVAMTLADGDVALCRDYIDVMMQQIYQPATPTFANAGKIRGGDLVSCYILEPEDTIESIERTIASVALLSKRGGGVAVCLTNLRGRGAPIREVEDRCSGVPPVAKRVEGAADYANQLGTREGAVAVWTHMCHYDTPELLDTKRENADEGIRLKNLSIGVVVPDIAYKLAIQNKELYLFCPYDIMRIYKTPMSKLGISKHYKDLVANPNIRKRKVNARQYFQTISFLQGQSGFPYIMNEDTVNALNPVDGYISSSNLCVSGETPLLTDKGEFPIQSLVGKTVNVWNGQQWSQTVVEKTGEGQHVVDVVLIDAKGGRKVLTCTDYHKWYISSGAPGNEILRRTVDLLPGMMVKFDLPTGPQTYCIQTINDNRKLIDTFCVTEPLRGRATFNGIVTGNCSEILQPSTASALDAALNYLSVGSDISCNLGSLNAVTSFRSGTRFGHWVQTAIRMLTSVAIKSTVECVPSIGKGNASGHSVGLGVMNLHALFATEGLLYGDADSCELTDIYYATMRYHAILASSDIAAEKKQSFGGFEKSKYYSGEVFTPYINRDWSQLGDKVKAIVEKWGFVVPTAEDWKALSEKVRKDGMFNRHLLATAPTGSISYINNSTASIAPIVDKIESRKEGLLGRIYYPAPYMTAENEHLYVDAYDIGYKGVIDVYAAATPHTDQGLSCTLYFYTNKTTTADVDKARNYAWSKGLKTMYYARFRSGDNDNFADVQNIKECEACAV